MIKLIIFDLDGVLIDARELHYEALNRALIASNQEPISPKEHTSTYDGLPTKVKLQKRNVPYELHKKIYDDKQKFTIEIIKKDFDRNERICTILKLLKLKDLKLYVASNSIRDTVKFVLHKGGFWEYIDKYYSNEDVKRSKPATDIYLECMIDAGVSPKETLIVEDSAVGRRGAYSSGANIFGVKNTADLRLDALISYIEELEQKVIGMKWQDKKLNILIPMAGAGSRFESAGYTFPKPLIEVEGKPMIQVVVENLNMEANYIFIVQKSHRQKYNLDYLLNLIAPNCTLIEVEGITEGAACTTLLAKDLINNNNPLLIANSDQFVEWDSIDFMYSMTSTNVDAGILTHESTHPKWSFAKLDENGFVTEVAEKKSISNIATVGIYYVAKGSDWVKYAEQMIQKNIRVNNEFYVCPVFNEFVEDGKKIKTHHVDKMWGLGTPEDLETFLKR